MHINIQKGKHSCTSCQVCGAVCPKDAIRIVLDDEGFYRPSVDPLRCIDCGICVSACYKFNDPLMTSDVDLAKIPVYASSSRDDDLVRETTSGGLADLLAESLIRSGYRCVGVSYDTRTNRAVNRVAITRYESLSFRGSKYIQSYTMDAFRKVLGGNLNEKTAVFGTPCQIYGIDLYLRSRRKRSNFLLIDLYCHGCPSMFLWDKYLDHLYRKGYSSFDKIVFRSKIRGWGNYSITGSSKNQFFVSPARKDLFYSLFFSDHALNEACHDCQCRSTLAHTDIRLGDFWGKSYDLNKRGMSLVTCVTPQGRMFFDSLKDLIVSRKHEHKDYLPYQSYGRIYHPDLDLRKRLLLCLSAPSYSLSDAFSLFYRHQSLSYKMKYHLRNLILLMPDSVVLMIKKIYH